MPLKPYGSPATIFTQRWQDELAPVAESAMAATIRIYDPRISEAGWDFELGEYVGGTGPTTIYSGSARVQPLRSATEKAQPGDTALTQAVLVSVPIGKAEGLVFDTFHLGEVTSAHLNPDLLRFVYSVREVVDSSNPFERTLLFSVNQEAVHHDG